MPDRPTTRLVTAPDRGLRSGARAVALYAASILGSSVAALVVFEMLVRLLIPQQLINVQFDTFEPADSIGWTFRSNLDTWINTGEREVRFVTNERGFRVDPEHHEVHECRVLLLGDSFMAAIQVEHNATFAAHMERGLASALGRGVTVWNTGVGGWDPAQYLIQARRMLGQEPIDLVVAAVYVGNDVVYEPMEIRPPLQPVAINRFRIPRGLTASEWIVALAGPADDRLKRRSHLYVLVKARVSYLRMRLGLTAAWFPDVHLTSLADSRRWDYTVDLLEQIRDHALKIGIPAVFVLVPSHFQVDRDALEEHVNAFKIDRLQVAIDQPNDQLTVRMRERALEVLDPLREFRRSFEAGEGNLFGQIDTHFNARGHAVMWEAVGPRITEIFLGSVESRTVAGSGTGACRGRS
jgi:hypothetical protein